MSDVFAYLAELELREAEAILRDYPSGWLQFQKLNANRIKWAKAREPYLKVLADFLAMEPPPPIYVRADE